MCRWLAYTGNKILLADLILRPAHNLIDQSLHARSSKTPTNGDGFGVGWYDDQPEPGLFRSIRPAWNDMNLIDLVNHIESPCFLAHIRAASLAPIQETNCHPFRYGKWLFVHNGLIANFDSLRQPLMSMISPKYFHNILGSTDSEIMFHLALTFGLEEDVPKAITEMVRVIEKVAVGKGIDKSIWMTLGISDGARLWGFRYGSDGLGPTLYINPNIEELRKMNPEIEERFGNSAYCLVSEPIGVYGTLWTPVGGNSKIFISEGDLEIGAFSP